jgi:predicted transcriptional regulator
MNRKKSFVLTKNDRKAARLFAELGMSKNLAKTLMYLSHVDECYSADIEQGANLRQPEVSLVMQELRRRKWVKKQVLKKKGKGRPRNVYKTTTHLSEILNDFEQEKLEEVEGIKGDISELKNLIESR